MYLIKEIEENGKTTYSVGYRELYETKWTELMRFDDKSVALKKLAYWNGNSNNIFYHLDMLNEKRCNEVFGMAMEKLSLTTLSNMVNAEAGELAGIAHKISMDCYPHNLGDNFKDVEDEVADVLITLHLFCKKLNIDIQSVTARKFNEVSKEKNSNLLVGRSRKFTNKTIIHNSQF